MSEGESQTNERSAPFVLALISGGIAGFAVDVALYPIDTIKTRLQSPQGFFKSGGFNGIYKGLGAVALGSAPGAALFFSTYETSKRFLSQNEKSRTIPESVKHMIAASVGEVMACLVRVPTEVVKQRMQTGMETSISRTVKQVISEKHGWMSLYTGFNITLMREIPFSLVQFPLYEYFKVRLTKLQSMHEKELPAYQAAICGSISGGIAAAVTTPLDVIKTRLMLGKDAYGVTYEGPLDTLKKLWNEPLLESKEKGLNRSSNQILKARTRLLFSGVEPRVMWITIGGFVFFGAYEQALKICKIAIN